jgi:23S rRNA pseudouridine1911/1915/1917 synthase
MGPLEILHEDNHLLAVNKPAELPTMGAPQGRLSVVELARDYLRQRYSKPGNVYVGVVSRLDAPVTGVLLLARTSKAAARLSAAFRERQVTKRYWALVGCRQLAPTGTLQHHVRKDESHRRMSICGPDHSSGQLAVLQYAVRGMAGKRIWVEVELVTGRKHQIRVQFAAIGCPILGDRLYGSSDVFAPGIALHSRSIELLHPVRRELLKLVAPMPSYWPELHANEAET